MIFEEYKKTTRLNDEAEWVVSIAESAFNAGLKAALEEAAEIAEETLEYEEQDEERHWIIHRAYGSNTSEILLKRAGEIT